MRIVACTLLTLIALAGCSTKTNKARLASPKQDAPPKAGEIRVLNKKDRAELVWVPPGEFLMGSKDGDPGAEKDEKPQRKVYLDGYWIYRYPVTVAQYRKFSEETGTGHQELGEGKDRRPGIEWMEDTTDDDPMTWVGRQEAAAYAEWAGASLPTEAQWEKAARGTDGRIYSWGNDRDASKHQERKDVGWIVSPVGSYPSEASPYGCEYMGRLVEWCSDWYDPDYYKKGPAKNPVGPSDMVGISTQFLRWKGAPVERGFEFRCASRTFAFLPTGGARTGFRCVINRP